MKKNQIICLGDKEILYRQTASLDVDAQCGFSELCPKELPVPGALEIVDELNRQARYAAKRVASEDAHSPDSLWIPTPEEPQHTPIVGYKDMDQRWNAHCIVGTMGFNFLPGLDPEAYHYIAYKGIHPEMHPYGACYHDLANTKSTGLIEYLVVNNIKNIIAGGLATSYCFLLTVLQLCATKRFTVFVNLAAIRDIPGADTAKSIEAMRAAGAIIINSSKEITLK